MFSYADIRRAEIALALWDRYSIDITDDDTILKWRTVEDVVQDVLAFAATPLSETESLSRVQKVIAEGWGIHLEDLAPHAELFGDRLRLDCRPFMGDNIGPSS